MNNGRYFTVTDYVRLEILIRSGLWPKMRKLGFYPVLAGETAQFRKPLLPFQKYQLSTRIVGWDEKFFYIEHTFSTGETVNALALMKICVIGPNNTRPTPVDIMRMVEPDAEDIRLDEKVDLWNRFQISHWQSTSKLSPQFSDERVAQ
jgi:acyl-CoA thioesterase FadM